MARSIEVRLFFKIPDDVLSNMSRWDAKEWEKLVEKAVDEQLIPVFNSIGFEQDGLHEVRLVDNDLPF